MNDALMYFLEVNIAIALFYLFYRLFFAGDTFWKTRRYYMLFSILLSFVYPFLSVESWLQKQEPVQKLIVNYATLPEFTVTAVRETTIFSLGNISMAIYGLVVLILLVRFILQLTSILRIRLHGTVKMVQNTRIIAIDKEVTPFSFFRLVFMNPELHNERETKEILAHELTHVRQGHSFDVLVSEVLAIILWLNPATWLLKREIRQNLEFLADNKVIESGFNSQTYQYHLLQLSYQTPEVKLGNKFNVSPLKKRIIMMNQQKTNKTGILKYSLIVPLALALVLSSNAQEIANYSKEVKKTETVVKGNIETQKGLENASNIKSNSAKNKRLPKDLVSVAKYGLSDIPSDLKMTIKGLVVYSDGEPVKNGEVLVFRGNVGMRSLVDKKGYFKVEVIKGGSVAFGASNAKLKHVLLTHNPYCCEKIVLEKIK